MPSIIDGLFAGRSGIQSHGTAISVLADNIANQNTTGFKQSRPDFSDLLAGSIGGAGSVATGSGSAIVSVTPILTQGTFEFTGRGLDNAIDGNGFFIVQDGGGTGARFYTRAGNFKLDTDGNLLDQNGFNVLGFPASGAGGLQPLNVNQRADTSIATTEVNISGNLDVSAPILTGAVPGAGSTFQQYSDAASFSTFVDVFDSLGQAHTATLYFYHTGTAQWELRAVVDDGDTLGGTPGATEEIGAATLDFSATGVKTSATPDIANTNIQWSNGAQASDIAFSLEPFTQFASKSNVGSIFQDGTGSGSVVGFSVQEDGTLFAQLDNGQAASIGVLALATFANAEGLARQGNSLFAQSSSSGEPVVGTPGAGTFGTIESGALELSTADIAGDFIKLISIQRGFQGSSRIITNIDDLLNEIINLA